MWVKRVNSVFSHKTEAFETHFHVFNNIVRFKQYNGIAAISYELSLQ